MKKSMFIMVIAEIAAFIYIRHLRIDMEIARFDCMMKIMKEAQRQDGE